MRSKRLSGNARFAVSGTLVARRAVIDCTGALLATNVPCTLDSSAILAFASRGASTARFEFVRGVKALEVAGQAVGAGDGACAETHGAEFRRLKSRSALPFMMVAVAGGFGFGGLVVRTFAAEGLRGPLPFLRALRVMVRMLRRMRKAEVVFAAPRPTRGGALLLRRGFVVFTGSAVGDTAHLLLEPELVVLAAGRLVMPGLTLPLVMVTRRLGRMWVGVVGFSFARVRPGGPFPFLLALRGVVRGVRLVRDAALVLLIPRPTGRRAPFLRRRFVVFARTPVRKAAHLLLEPELMALATRRLMMPRFTLPLMTRGLGGRRMRMVGFSLARVRPGGPFPFLLAFRSVVRVLRLVRDAALVLLAPRPTGRRALLVRRGLVVFARPTVGETAHFFFEPKLMALATGRTMAGQGRGKR